MIQEVRLSDSINFKQNDIIKKPSKYDESEIVPNTVRTRVLQKYDKTLNAMTEYPAKGLKGDVNSDFYEFLSMGIIPYLIGSGMFIAMFNLLNKHLTPNASLRGKKMGLGVLFYGIAKTLANDAVTRPVYHFTGVDIELPYRNIYCTLPTKPGAEADIDTKHQQRKVYDSIEFFRKDLIAKNPKYGNFGVKYYDGIAKKLGMGDNLNDSVSETTPIIQSIVASTKTAKSLASYCWAAAGVCVAAQNDWADFFKAFSDRPKYIAKQGEGFFSKVGGKLANTGKNIWNLSGTFLKTFGKACKSLWVGESKGFRKHAGKAWLLFTAALTVGTVYNAIHRAKIMGKLANKDLIDKNQESTVI